MRAGPPPQLGRVGIAEPSRAALILSWSPPGRRPPADGREPEAAPSPALKERIAALALKQVAFGSVSLLPVRFEGSRLAGPIEDGGRTIYCVSSRMSGRTFGKPERPKAAMRYHADRLEVIDDDEVCTGHRSQPFPELDALGNGREAPALTARAHPLRARRTDAVSRGCDAQAQARFITRATRPPACSASGLRGSRMPGARPVVR